RVMRCSFASPLAVLSAPVSHMPPPPPSSPLFPYTTLFRSLDRGELSARPGVGSVDDGDARHVLRGHEPRGRDHRLRHYPGQPREDRKSTRLNSSHGSISYAVFCLKKKKRKQRTTATTMHTP